MEEDVKKGYEEGHYLEDYREGRELRETERELLDQLIDMLADGSRILDLGCGNGVPFDLYLDQKGFDLTGVDIAENHVYAARGNLPDARFIQGNFFEQEFERESFDGIVSFYAIFHIPREKHLGLLRKMHGWLSDNGAILITLGADEMKEDSSEFSGSEMVWSSYSMEDNIELVKEAGFELVETYEEDAEEHHLWVLARKV